VGGADPTKNLETLIDAFARLPGSLRDAYDLVLVGDLRRRQDLRERVRQAGFEKQTHFAGIVADERLIELYQQATLFVFPTLYEGFGLPVLEAMACGTPVLCSNVASLPEVAGDAAILFDPLDRRGLSATMMQVLSDDDVRRQLTDHGRQQASKFSWDDTARGMVSVYERVAQGLCPQ
jgi:glycosyltransferase involved in cell wall biosynthesis